MDGLPFIELHFLQAVARLFSVVAPPLDSGYSGYCRKQQAEFSRANVRYRILDVDTEEGGRAMRAVGARPVPVTIIGQDLVRGYNVAALDEKLSPLGYRVY